jgi:transposase-like protein
VLFAHLVSLEPEIYAGKQKILDCIWSYNSTFAWNQQYSAAVQHAQSNNNREWWCLKYPKKIRASWSMYNKNFKKKLKGVAANQIKSIFIQ